MSNSTESKKKKIEQFDQNSYANLKGNLFGLPYTIDEADIVIVPIPWEVTVSYRDGTANGPTAVFQASMQIDLYDPAVKDAWKVGIVMDEISKDIRKKSDALRPHAAQYIEALMMGQNPESTPELQDIVREINEACKEMNAWVKDRVLHFMNQRKVVGLLGGDHSTPLGMIQAVGEKFGDFGILQIDAHADLRDAYEGFEFSHASIMFNALKNKSVQKLVQVGIRDYCEAEADLARTEERVHTFYDRDIKYAMLEGETWANVCDRIIAELPDQIYLSFDIDGLDPKLCANTGTPVAGGFEVDQVIFLIERIVKAGKRFVAFDINEISPGDQTSPDEDSWDANVGARLLYRIANLVGKSNGLKAVG